MKRRRVGEEGLGNSKLFRRNKAIMALSTLAIGSMAALGILENSEVDGALGLYEMAHDAVLEDCKNPSQATIDWVYGELSNINFSYSKMYLFYDPIYKNQKIKEAADKSNLTVYSNNVYLERLSQNTSTSNTELLKIANEYLANFNTKVYLDKVVNYEDDYYDSSLMLDLKHILNAFSMYPKELVDYANLRTILITEFDNGNEGQADLYAHKAMRLNAARFNEKTINHELWHFLDRQNCGVYNMFYDKSFTSYNPDGADYGKDAYEQRLSFDRDTFVGIYSQSNPAEDKATLGQNIIGGLDPALSTSKNPLGEKYRFLVARLESEIPGIVEFYVTLRLNK